MNHTEGTEGHRGTEGLHRTPACVRPAVQRNRSTHGAEDLKFSVLAGAWLLVSVWAAVLGWRGQLLGARVRHAAPADGGEGEAEHPRLTGG